MTRKPIRVKRALMERITRKLEKHGIPIPVYRGWQQFAESEIARPKDERPTRYIPNGRDSFHEFETTQPFDGCPYKIVFELELLDDVAELLDLHIISTKPNLQDE